MYPSSRKPILLPSRRSPVVIAAVVLVASLVVGCSLQVRPRGSTYEITDYKLEIRSNTTWSASYDDGKAHDGEFNDTIDLPDDIPPVCAVVTKKTEDGYVRARVAPTGGWIETSMANGTISPCAER